MKRLINICLFLAFLVGYLEWGKNQHAFIFKMETEILVKGFNDFKSIFHPLILIPFAGQIMILVTIFQKKISRLLSLAGLACLSTLMLLLFIIGLLSFNFKVTGSTIPFMIAGIFVLKYHWKKSKQMHA
jgi:hypothetical protein